MTFQNILDWTMLTENNLSIPLVVTLSNVLLCTLTLRCVFEFLKRKRKRRIETKYMDKVDLVESNKKLIDENKNLITKLREAKNKIKTYSFIKDCEENMTDGINELINVGQSIAKMKYDWNTKHFMDRKSYENIHETINEILVRPEYSEPNEFKYRNLELLDLLVEWHSRFPLEVKWGDKFSLSYMLILMDQIREIQDVIIPEEFFEEEDDSDSEWVPGCE